jgi:hypothetical protein
MSWILFQIINSARGRQLRNVIRARKCVPKLNVAKLNWSFQYEIQINFVKDELSRRLWVWVFINWAHYYVERRNYELSVNWTFISRCSPVFWCLLLFLLHAYVFHAYENLEMFTRIFILIAYAVRIGAGVTQSIQCHTTDWTTGGVQSPAESKDISSSFCVQTDCGGVQSPAESKDISSSVCVQTNSGGVQSPAESKDISSSLCVQTDSGAHPASYPVGTGGPYPGVKRGRAWEK